MASFAVAFLGCKVSQTDAQGLRERLVAGGHIESGGATDVAVVNTCCVTHEAVRKSRQVARRAARRAGRVYLTGCGANLSGDAFGDLPDNVTVVRLPSERASAWVAGDVGAIGCVRADVGLGRVRAFVKVQDGCSFGCAFCVIPQVRGASRSRPAAGETPGLARLRLSSLEVNHLSDELLAAMRETPAVSPHLHVPLQSGDDRVLGAMRRRYSAATYLRRTAKAEGMNLTTDVIVGFPGEDEAAFANTLRVVEEAGITKVHAFPYSPRPGTRTAAEDTVPPAVKKERSARLRAASAEACRRRWEEKLGGEDVVLVDRPGRGYGDDYTPWLVEGPVGEMIRVRGRAVREEGIVGVAA